MTSSQRKGGKKYDTIALCPFEAVYPINKEKDHDCSGQSKVRNPRSVTRNNRRRILCMSATIVNGDVNHFEERKTLRGGLSVASMFRGIESCRSFRSLKFTDFFLSS